MSYLFLKNFYEIFSKQNIFGIVISSLLKNYTVKKYAAPVLIRNAIVHILEAQIF